MSASPTIISRSGLLRTLICPDPAPGSEISEVVPARRRWKILGIRYALTTDITEADRHSGISISDGINTMFFFQCACTQAASLTYYYQFSSLPAVEFQVYTFTYFPFPNLTLPAGTIISTITTNFQAGDDYGPAILFVEEWIDP